MCSFRPGATPSGPIPSYDAAVALRADARTIEDGRADAATTQRLPAVTSTIGYLSPIGLYLSLTQSNADEDKLVTAIQPAMRPTGPGAVGCEMPGRNAYQGAVDEVGEDGFDDGVAAMRDVGVGDGRR